MSANNQLTTRVSDETAAKFHQQREEMGLSINQFLKFLVLAAQDEVDKWIADTEPFGAHVAGEKIDDEDRDRLIQWLRGK